MKHLMFILIVVTLASCKGVSYSFQGGTIPGKTFSYNDFPNNASIVNPNLSIEFQDELRKKMLSESNLSFEERNADVYFEGEITNYYVEQIVGTGNDFSTRSRLNISIKVKYTNKTDAKLNFDKSYSDYEDFDSDVDFSSKEEELTKLIVEKLIIKVYNDILVGF